MATSCRWRSRSRRACVTENVIETHGLRKQFGAKTAVENLSLAVRRGEVFGVLGPNGAGKTTAIKILLALVATTARTGRALRAPLGHHGNRVLLGVIPAQSRLH